MGSLIFLTHTRPDITYSVSLVSRYMTNLSEIHMEAAKRILRYVKGTLNFGIHYYSFEKFNLVGFSDSDWGGSVDDGKSTSGNCFSFGSGLITWSKKKKNHCCPLIHRSRVCCSYLNRYTNSLAQKNFGRN